MLATCGRKRQAQAFFLCIAALCAAASANATPGTVASKQAQAQQVLAQIQQIDDSLGAAVESYNLANVRLQKIETDQRENRTQLKLTRKNLKVAQDSLAARLVSAYTSTQDNSTLSVLLGASSLDDLLNRIEAVNSTSRQDASIVQQVTSFKAAIQRHREELRKRPFGAADDRRAEGRAEAADRVAAGFAPAVALVDQGPDCQDQSRRGGAAAPARSGSAVSPRGSPGSRAGRRGRLGLDTGGVDRRTSERPRRRRRDRDALPRRAVRLGRIHAARLRLLRVRLVRVRSDRCLGCRTARTRSSGWARPSRSSQLQPGDLVFFAGASHVGIYIGGGQFIHAPHTGDVVKISSLSGYYSSNFAGGRRI